MTKYIYSTESTNGYSSGYESDGGTFYDENGLLGKGSFARARKFHSKDGRKGKAILDPTRIDHMTDGEVLSKYQFFQTIYPRQGVELIQKGETYRLVLPLIPGKTYADLPILSTVEQIKLFISAIKALEDCHKKGYVVVDLHEDNIHYDASTGKSYLIDGGLAVKTGGSLHYRFVKAKKPTTRGFHFAPECFSLQGARAAETMDIYSLGNILEETLTYPAYTILPLLQQCQLEDPTQRPSLQDLEARLVAMLLDIEKLLPRTEIRKIPVNFLDKMTGNDIKEHRWNLQKKLSDIVIKTAHKAALSPEKVEEYVQKEYRDKMHEIDWGSKLQLVRITKIEKVLESINDALNDLETNLNALEYYHSPQGKETGQELLENLKQHKETYFNMLFLPQAVNDSDALDEFKTVCREEIDKARPILEKEFGWEEQLTNSAIAFINVSIKKATLGYCGAFFQPTPSKSLECVENTAQELENLALIF